jgi:hypothetical protein
MSNPCIPSAVFDDPRYDSLTPTQSRALPRIMALVQKYGKDGVLAHFRREHICRKVGLRSDLYERLLVDMAENGWGGRNAEGWLFLCGPLLHVPAPVMSAPEIAALVADLMAAAMPAAVAAGIKAYWAEKKRISRSGGKAEDAEAEEGEMSETFAQNVRDNQTETDPNVSDNPSRTRAFDSNRFESNDSIDNILSSIRIDSKEPAPPTQNDAAPTPPHPKLTLQGEMLPADVIQAIIALGILPRNAAALFEKHGMELCVLRLNCLPYSKNPNKAQAFQASLKNPDWEIPKEVAQMNLSLLTGVQGGAPKSAHSPAKTAKPPENSPIQEARESLTETERHELQMDAVNRLQPETRKRYNRHIEEATPFGPIVRSAIEAAENEILAEMIDEARKAVGE